MLLVAVHFVLPAVVELNAEPTQTIGHKVCLPCASDSDVGQQVVRRDQCIVGRLLALIHRLSRPAFSGLAPLIP